MKASFLAVLLLLSSAAIALAETMPHVVILKQPGKIDRSILAGTQLETMAGAVLYSERSLGLDVTYLDAPFSHHPAFGANLDVSTDEPLTLAIVETKVSACTIRPVSGRDVFVCFSGAGKDGNFDHWQRITRSSTVAGRVGQDFSPDPSEAMAPIHTRKGRANPKDGEECIIEIRYAGIFDGKLKFTASARLANQAVPFKQIETLVAPAANGPTTVEIRYPIDAPALDVVAQYLQSPNPSGETLSSLLSGAEGRPETMTLEVAKATPQSVSFAVRRPFREWQYWRTTDANGKEVTHSAWGAAPPAPLPTFAGGVDLVNRDAVAHDVFVCGDGCDVFQKHGQNFTLAAGETRKDLCLRDCLFVIAPGGMISVNDTLAEIKAGRVFNGDVLVSIVDGKIVAPK